MLVVEEIVRDIICNEVIEIAKELNNLSLPPTSPELVHIKTHLGNISEILLSENDFKRIPNDPKEFSLNDFVELLIQKGQ